MAAEHVERIGARIRTRREELGLTRRQLVATMQGVVTENDIYRWEKGQHRPQDDTLEEIARALQVDAAYFLASSPGAASEEIPTQLDRIENKLDGLIGILGPIAQPGAEDAQSGRVDGIQSLLNYLRQELADQPEDSPEEPRASQGKSA